MERVYWSGDKLPELPSNGILVFGSNPEGRHGLGLAKVSREQFKAQYGNGRGLRGRSYALVTKNLTAGFTEASTGITYEGKGYRSVTPRQIHRNIKELYECCLTNPDKLFYIPYVFTYKRSLNGYTGEDMYKMFNHFKTIPTNVIFHDSYNKELNNE